MWVRNRYTGPGGGLYTGPGGGLYTGPGGGAYTGPDGGLYTGPGGGLYTGPGGGVPMPSFRPSSPGVKEIVSGAPEAWMLTRQKLLSRQR